MGDIITVGQSSGGNKGQINEIIEHLLHAISDVGLSKQYPKQWGFQATSEVSLAMKEAIANKVYNVEDYKAIPEPPRHRIEVQEYAYWLIIGCWGFRDIYTDDKEGEFSAKNNAAIKVGNPKGYKLFWSTVGKIMKMPTKATMDMLGRLLKGQTPPPATHVSAGTTLSSPKNTCSSRLAKKKNKDGKNKHKGKGKKGKGKGGDDGEEEEEEHD